MRSDILNRHMQIHDKYVEVEPLPSVTSTYVPPMSGISDSIYKPANMDKELLLKKMLKGDREYKEKMKMGEQMYEFVKDDGPLALSIVHTPRLTTFGGGFPIIVDGQVVGGIGVSGGHYSEDMECARSALDKLK